MASDPVRIANSLKLGEEFELDLRAYELRRSGQPLRLERIPMDLLLLLVREKEQLVTRDQIVEKIWGKDVYVDADTSINTAVRKIRHALRDDPEKPRFIQTVTGKGYRYIGLVSPGEASPITQEPPAPAAGVAAEPLARSKPSQLRLRGWTLGAALLTIAVFIAAAVGVYLRWRRPQIRSGTAEARIMLAVLPFENLTGDTGQEYFSDGLTEEMISQLGNLDPKHLGVIARTSVMHYKNSGFPLDRIGTELQVQYVLEGSVRRDANNVRVTAELIQVKDQTHLWARQYDRHLQDLLALQGEIAREIADEIQLTIDSRKKQAGAPAQPAVSAEAYDAYLKGQYFWNKRNPEAFKQAIHYFQQAIDIEPNYARAYAGLADSYALLSGYDSSVPSDVVMPKARAAAVRAIELDQNLAEGHTALAVIAQNYDWDWQTAEREYKRAIELTPNYATAHHWYGEFLALQGRFDEAFREIERARQLDPLSLIIGADYGAILYYARQYDRSIEQFQAVLDMEPSFRRAHVMIWPLVEKGFYKRALAALDEWERKGTETKASVESIRAYVYFRAGDTAQGQKALARLNRLYRAEPLDPAIMFNGYVATGDRDSTIFWLDKACTAHSSGITNLKVNPAFDSLRGDPRFVSILQRMHLSP